MTEHLSLPVSTGLDKWRDPWPKWAQWACGLFTHEDRNTALRDRHGAVCMRCGKVFGWWWKTAVVSEENPLLRLDP